MSRKCGYGQPQDCTEIAHPECDEFNKPCPTCKDTKWVDDPVPNYVVQGWRTVPCPDC